MQFVYTMQITWPTHLETSQWMSYLRHDTHILQKWIKQIKVVKDSIVDRVNLYNSAWPSINTNVYNTSGKDNTGQLFRFLCPFSILTHSILIQNSMTVWQNENAFLNYTDDKPSTLPPVCGNRNSAESFSFSYKMSPLQTTYKIEMFISYIFHTLNRKWRKFRYLYYILDNLFIRFHL